MFGAIKEIIEQCKKGNIRLYDINLDIEIMPKERPLKDVQLWYWDEAHQELLDGFDKHYGTNIVRGILAIKECDWDSGAVKIYLAPPKNHEYYGFMKNNLYPSEVYGEILKIRYNYKGCKFIINKSHHMQILRIPILSVVITESISDRAMTKLCNALDHISKYRAVCITKRRNNSMLIIHKNHTAYLTDTDETFKILHKYVNPLPDLLYFYLTPIVCVDSIPVQLTPFLKSGTLYILRTVIDDYTCSTYNFYLDCLKDENAILLYIWNSNLSVYTIELVVRQIEGLTKDSTLDDVIKVFLSKGIWKYPEPEKPKEPELKKPEKTKEPGLAQHMGRRVFYFNTLEEATQYSIMNPSEEILVTMGYTKQVYLIKNGKSTQIGNIDY